MYGRAIPSFLKEKRRIIRWKFGLINEDKGIKCIILQKTFVGK